jgi:hypothetical protein
MRHIPSTACERIHGTVIVDSLGKELDGTKWRSEIATKKEAKALAASLNDELQELKAQ